MRAFLTLALTLVCSSTAFAANIPVLAPNGAISHRHEPGISARGERTHVRVREPRRATIAAAGRPGRKTTLSVLEKLGSDYGDDISQYKKARRSAKRFSGIRRIDMDGVIAVIDRMAAAGKLTASRLPVLMLTLKRNVQWWNNGSLLANGARVSFKGSELIFQYVPREGLQFHPLANFGVLNALTHQKTATDRMEKMFGEILPLAAKRAGGIAWEYYFDFGGGAPPWVSGLAQGTGLQAMARAATKAGRSDVIPMLKKGLTIFQTRTPEGVRVPAGAGVHYAQYSFAPGLRIINGFIQSLVGLFDFASLTGDQTAQQLFAEGDARARQELPSYDTGAWSLYDRGTDSHESNLNYHEVLIDFLKSICTRTDTPVYCDTLANFKRYMKEAPEVDVTTRALKAGKSGSLKFKLSKIATINLSLKRDGKVVYTYRQTLGYGTHSLTIKPPKKASDYDVRVSATDPAGNTGTYTDTVAVERK